MSFAQTWEQRRLDTLLPKLVGLKDDTIKVKLLGDISHSYFTIDPEEGIKKGHEGRLLAEKLSWAKGIAQAYSSIGANYWAKNDFLTAQSFFLKALKISEDINDKKGMAKGFHSLATICLSLYNYPKALDFYMKALKINEEICDTPYIYGCLANIGNVYESQKNYSQAINYYTKSLVLAEKEGDKGDITYRLGAIGFIHAKQGNFSKALVFMTLSLKLTKEIGVKNDIAKKTGDIGQIYLLMGNYDLALKYFQNALSIFNKVPTSGAKSYRGKYTSFVGKVYLLMATSGTTGSKNNQYPAYFNRRALLNKAIENFKLAIPLLKSVRDHEALQDVHFDLSEAQNKIGDARESLDNYKYHVLYKDSVNNLERDKEITRNELEYEYGKQTDSLSYVNDLQKKELRGLIQEKELNKLRLRQQWLITIIAIILLGTISSYFIFRHRVQGFRLKTELAQEKVEKQLKEAEYQQQVNNITFSALRSQMNPHFIFNALNTIQSYVYSNDKKSASNYLGKFSDLIRKILDNSNKQKITLEEEIHVLQLYIDIEKARFGDTFNAVIEIDPDLDTEDIFVPPMLIQPYAENAIKHGLLHQSGEKRLLIRLSKSTDQQYIEIIIDDNGIGREQSIEINKRRVDHHSFANAANERRIDLINQLHDKKTRLEIIDKKNADGMAAGTTVIIRIPVMSVTEV